MKLFTTFCCAALALCGGAFAQPSADHITVRFNTPVMVGETTLPAGNCDIQVMRGSSDSIILILRSQGAPAITALASHLSGSDANAGENASVVLTHRGNALQLDQIMMGGHTGYQLNNVD